jgi:hypothetical protein
MASNGRDGMRRRPLLPAALAAALWPAAAWGQTPPTLPEPPPRGSGAPPPVSHCAQPSDNGKYFGYYVGGGAPCHGEPRFWDEGTWGWDYCGCLPSCVFLQWYHGRRYQGGAGAYKIDGPHLLHEHHPPKKHEGHEHHQ